MNSVKLLTRKTKTIPSQVVDQSTKGVETTGGRMVFLNNQLELPATSSNRRDDIVRSIWKHIVNINAMALPMGLTALHEKEYMNG